jgi:hypothetical protein
MNRWARWTSWRAPWARRPRRNSSSLRVAEKFATSTVVGAMRDLTAATATDAVVSGAKLGVAAVENAEGKQRTAER